MNWAKREISKTEARGIVSRNLTENDVRANESTECLGSTVFSKIKITTKLHESGEPPISSLSRDNKLIPASPTEDLSISNISTQDLKP